MPKRTLEETYRTYEDYLKALRDQQPVKKQKIDSPHQSDYEDDYNNVNIVTLKHKKKILPKALRQQVWLNIYGDQFNGKCPINWCNNIISVFSFHTCHNTPKSLGGETSINNLLPLCKDCNLGIGDKMTATEWNNLYQ